MSLEEKQKREEKGRKQRKGVRHSIESGRPVAATSGLPLDFNLYDVLILTGSEIFYRIQHKHKQGVNHLISLYSILSILIIHLLE